MVTQQILTSSLVAATIGMFCTPPGPRAAAQAPPAKQPRLSPEIYTAYVRQSLYVPVKDGTRLALDIHRPVKNGVVVENRLPVVLTATPYLRARLEGKRLVTPVEGNSILGAALRRGFVVASLDLRGYGASFGRPGGNGDDVSDIISWLASQSWTSGKVGMFGCSAVGASQFSTVGATPAHLSTVAATSAPMDPHVVMRVNGVAQVPFLANWQQRMRNVDTDESARIPPVDSDSDGTLLQEALKERRAVWAKTANITDSRSASRFRPPLSPDGELFGVLAAFQQSKTPLLNVGGWHDLFADQSVAWYRNLATLNVPQKLIMGPWHHCEWNANPDTLADHIRWYEYWLKGVDNGVTAEPSIRYYTMHAPEATAWRIASRWPLPNARTTTYYLHPGRSTTIASVNDGRLQLSPANEGVDRYVVDRDVTSIGLSTRWNTGVRPKNFDVTPISLRALTYTTDPFEADTEITGFPVLNVWASSTASDEDFFVYLALVERDGKATMVSDGAIRASNRAVDKPPYDNEGLPWHGGFEARQERLKPGEPVRLDFAMFPTSFYVAKGNRVMLTIANADKGNWDTPDVPASTVMLYHDRIRASSITLPIIKR
jgi:putative CocE/NonD family hydrolase